MHAELPVIILYVPAAHNLHANPSAPDEPALHVQLVDTPLAISEFVFDGQDKHVVDEVAATLGEY